MAQKPPYEIAGRQTIAQCAEVRVNLMTLDPGQEIPWHTHTRVADASFCLKGRVRLFLRDPEETADMAPGDWRRVDTGRPHRVLCLGDDQCQVLLVQGVGEYDFLKL